MNDLRIVIETPEYVIWQAPAGYKTPEKSIYYAESKRTGACSTYKRTEGGAVRAARKAEWRFVNNPKSDW